MKKTFTAVVRAAFLLSLILLFSSCSMENPNIKDQAQGFDNEMSEEVPKNHTPMPQTPEAEQVFAYPKDQISQDRTEMLKPIYETVSLKYLQASKACEILGRIASDCIFAEGCRSNLLVIKAFPQDMAKVRRLAGLIDVPSPRIMIESRVVEVLENELDNIGISWASNASGLKFVVSEQGVKFDSISAAISALISSGKAKLIANPSIATIDDHEASVNIGSKIPFAVPVSSNSSSSQWAVQYIDAGVSLKITPRLGEKGLITVNIHPEVSSISEWRATSAGEFPVISTRNADTCLEIMNGQTIVIGGLINETDRENMSKIPFAGDIPVIKELFSKRTTERTRTEVVFLITPRVI